MIDPELQALVLSGPVGILAVLGACVVAVACALVALRRQNRMQKSMAAEFVALNGWLAAAHARAQAQAQAHAEALHAAISPPGQSPVDAADMMALTDAVRSLSATVARIDRQVGDIRLLIRTQQADTGSRLDQMAADMRAAVAGSERLAVDLAARVLAAAPATVPGPRSDAGTGQGDDGPVPRERVPEPFRRPVPRQTE